jgi:hypothetical protein
MCETCSAFDEFYFDDSLVSLPILFEEIDAAKLLSNTDEGRMNRGRFNIKKCQHVIKDDEGKLKNVEKIEFNVKANPSTEQRNHIGYVIYDPKTHMVYELYCCCQDFQYKIFAPMVKNKLAKWDIAPKYKAKEIERIKAGGFGKHNRQWTKKTNPSGKLYVCKHLAHILHFFIMLKSKSEK